jgi:hypothetical protein
MKKFLDDGVDKPLQRRVERSDPIGRETDLAGLGHPSPVSSGGQVNDDIYQELLKQHVLY